MNKVVPLFVLWGISHYRNKILSENFFRNDFGLCSRIVLAIKEIPSATRGDNIGFLMILAYFWERPLRFFVGANGGGECGVGIVLKLSGIHFYRLQLVVGKGSNINEEFFGLWGFLNFLLICHIKELMVVGYSKVVFDWFVGMSQLNYLNLQLWMNKIIYLKHHFSWLK